MRNFIITIDGKSYSVGVEEVGETVGGVQSVAPVQSAPKAAASEVKEVKAAPAKGEKLLSPFPGIIKNVLVKDGDSVKKDQPIVVLEAMKMDNDITSPCDGTVTVKVAKGASVETNTVLAVIG